MGYFLKYQSDDENQHLAGPSYILAVLTSALLSPNYYTIPSTISLERVFYFYKFIVEYIIRNEYEVEKMFRSQKKAFEYRPEDKHHERKIKR